MSHYWQTQIYYESDQEWTSGFFGSVMQALGEIGLEFSKDPATGLGHYHGPDTPHAKEVSSLEAALELVEQHQSGFLDLYNPALDVRSSLSIHSKGKNRWISEGSAEADFASLRLHIPSGGVLNDHYILQEQKLIFIFQASLLLAKMSKAIYGVGDLEITSWGGDLVLAKDLIDRQIPRLGWWNYFGKEYDALNESGRFATSSHWVYHSEPDGAVMIITRPPSGKLYSKQTFDV